MAGTITSAGLGSGLAVESIISQLMQLERQPITQLQSRISTVDARLSALGRVKSAMSALQTAANDIKTAAGFSVFKTAVGDSNVLTASAGSSANVANHSVEVKSLAATQKLAAQGLASSTSAIATGTLKLELGSFDGAAFTADPDRTYTVEIGTGNNTLEGLRDAINDLDADVTASIVNDGSASPARLVLSPKDSGTANVIRSSGLSGFDFDPEAPLAGAMEQTVTAKDAVVVVDGITVTKSSNVITDALEGVTLNLADTNEGTPTTLDVSQDVDAIKGKIQAFVDAFNGLNSLIRGETSFNVESGQAGTLNADSSVRSIRDQLRQIASSDLDAAVGGLTRLSDIGISFDVEGALSIDSSALDEALADPTKNVAGLFTGSGSVTGLAAQISDRLGSLLGVGGTIESRTNSYTQSKDGFGDRIEQLERRMTAIEDRYRRQYAALDTLVASMNTTGNFLSQQLLSLQNLTSNG
ncbi:MAG: flagellar filament capping protein FliD [Rhodocyclaceae bacterium]|nr:flagellar filament capping protein FliD [Rhodocyclaceae bacterium]